MLRSAWHRARGLAKRVADSLFLVGVVTYIVMRVGGAEQWEAAAVVLFLVALLASKDSGPNVYLVDGDALRTEPDKIQWIDEATGYDCLIVRNRLGALCGYVGVPPQHKCHGVGYSHVSTPSDEWGPDVHGGLTYADACQEEAAEAEGICHLPFPGRPGDVWWLGFDCAHSGDLVPDMRRYYQASEETYRTVTYVRREIASLARQLVDAFPRPWEDDDA